MGYRVDKNLNKKGIRNKKLRNKKLRNRSLLAAIVFTLSIISNSIVPKTLLVTATENNKFNIDNVIVEEKVNSNDGIFEITREAEKVSESEIKVSVNLRINKDNIPILNNNINTQNTQEVTESEVDATDESQEEIQNEAVDKKEESVDIKKSISNAIITESLVEGFSIVDDSIKLEEVKEEGNVDLTEALRNSEYTDLSMESLENKLDIELKNISYSEIKLSYSITINSNIKALDNTALFSESLLKYNLVENSEGKIANIPNAVVSVKELVVDEAVENNVDKNQDEVSDYIDETQEDEESATLGNSNVIPDTITYDLLSLVDNPDSIDFPVTIRDFNYDQILFKPPYRDPYIGGKGMVDTELGADKKPIFLGGNNYNMDKIAKAIQNNRMFSNGLGGYSDAQNWYNSLGNKKNDYNKVKDEIDTAYKYLYYHFNNLFNDVSGLNMQDNNVIKKITLNKDETSTKYTFDSSKSDPYKTLKGFFPLDGNGFKESIDGNGGKHNFHFTLESHSRFWVGKDDNLVFNFTGDDDVWVYVNGELVIDIGGIHEAQNASFKIENGTITSDKRTINLGTEKWVDFDFFYMERNPTQSNLKIETNIKFKPNMTIEKQAYLINSEGKEIILNNNDRVYPGETIYYKFIIKNKGNVDLTNISFQDDILNIKIDKDGVYKKNQNDDYESINYNDLMVIKDNTVVNKNKLSALNSLPLKDGEDTYIEIKSKDFLKYTIKESDIPSGSNSGEITNRVIGKANYYTVGQGTIQESAEATVTVIPTPITETIARLDAKIIKTIYKVIRGEDTIYPNQNNSLPQLIAGDKVIFKFDIQNKSTSRNMLENGQVSNWVPIAIEGLKLEDTLAINVDKYTKTDFTYYELDSNSNKVIFNNYQNFGLGTDSKLTLYSDWEITPDEANYYNYELKHDVTNTVKLLKTGQGAKEFEPSSVNMKIQPPALKIQKCIEDGSLQDSKLDRTFTIMINGNDGTQYNIEAEKDIEYTLSNLKYGVTYTVSEIVPMNYKLKSIKVGENNQNSIFLDEHTSGTLFTITNEKVNDKFWTSENGVINEFKYTINDGLKFVKQLFNFDSKEE